MKKVRITSSTFFISCFITPWHEQFLRLEGHRDRSERKDTVGKRVKRAGATDSSPC